LELARKHLPNYEQKVRALRDTLEDDILASIQNCEQNGHESLRLANTANISFYDIESEALLLLLDKEGICASTGSACLADSDEPSHVIKAMKPESAASRQMIRFSLGLENRKEGLTKTVEAVGKAIAVLCS
jgi:cysteine desulfurase